MNNKKFRDLSKTSYLIDKLEALQEWHNDITYSSDEVKDGITTILDDLKNKFYDEISIKQNA